MTDEIEEIEGRAQYTPEDLRELGAKWLERIAASEKYGGMDRWTRDAEAAERAYLCDGHDNPNDVPSFNILHSNVETIVPSIYNSTPKPDIRPRYGKDTLAKRAGDVIESVIALQIDDNRLDAEVEKVAQDAFLAGRGVARVKFDADSDDMGNVTGERIICEVVAWSDYREGPAKKWADVPWVAYRHCLSHEDVKRIGDEELIGIQRAEGERESEDSDVLVWEIWCKSSGRVYFVVAGNGKVLSIVDDPMGLTGFFPQAAPIQPITATSKRTPVCPYTVYKTLAEELDTQTRRINAIVEGLKVKGIIAADASDIEALAQADDNTLVPVANLENLAATGGLEKAIVWWPIQHAITVLRELYVQRDQTKQTIYEITGISDIVRGASNAGETATAQNIKTQWGSLRIKKMQRLVERMVRDLFVIYAEIVASKFSLRTLQMSSGIEITPEIQAFFNAPLNHYRINVESDSTVRADASRNRQEMSEFLQGTAQYFSTMAPIVQQAPASAGPIVEMYSSFARQFNLGRQAEDALEQFAEMAKQTANQPQPNPEAEKLKAETEAKKAELQLKAQGQQQDAQIKTQEAAAKLQIERERLDLERAKFGLEVQRAQSETTFREREMAASEQDAAGKMAQGSEALSGLVEQAFGGILAEIRAGNQGLAEMVAQLGAAMRDGNTQIVAAMTAPKELIRDANGRPVGVRTAAGEQRVVN